MLFISGTSLTRQLNYVAASIPAYVPTLGNLLARYIVLRTTL